MYTKGRLDLRSSLSIDECVARLSRSGWTRKAKSDERQPVEGDLDVFRRIEDMTFVLDVRPSPRNRLPDVGDYRGTVFRGELHPCPVGTEVVIHFGPGLAAKTELLQLMVLPLFAFPFLALGVIRLAQGRSGGDLLLVGILVLLISLAGSAILWKFRERRTAAVRAKAEYVVKVLQRLLEAERTPESEYAGRHA